MKSLLYEHNSYKMNRIKYTEMENNMLKINKISIKQSLRGRITIYFTFVALIPILSLTFLYINQYKENAENNLINDAQNNLFYMMSNVNNTIKSANQMADWYYTQSQLDKILTYEYTSEGMKNYEIIQFIKAAQTNINTNQLINAVSKILVSGLNGVEFQIGDGLSTIDPLQLQDEDWYEQFKVRIPTYIIQSPEAFGTERLVIPLTKEIRHSVTGAKIGWCVIFYNADYLSRVFENYTLDTKDELFLVNEYNQIVAHIDKKYIGEDISNDDIVMRVKKQNNETGWFKVEEHLIVNYHFSANNGMTMIQKTDISDLLKEQEKYFNTVLVIFIGVLFIIFIMNMNISKRLTKPISIINDRLNKIATGDFSFDHSIETMDEVGTIGKGINKMSADIQSMIKQLIEDEQYEKQLEFQMLQNQINPHFLYNTLNSIKWIATIQESDAIVEMTSALARLLQNISRSPNEIIPIYDELLLLDDYIYIQKIRYNDTVEVSYSIADPQITEYGIPKFTLQPLVENAIFHGIAAKKGIGKVCVQVREENTHILIRIVDNGVGIDEDKLKNLKRFNSVGLRNVNERLKLLYGDNYGLTIKSKVGFYTVANICIPKEKVVFYD